MFKREIRVRPELPEVQLSTITVGMFSAASLIILGVPTTAANVRFDLMFDDVEAKTTFDAVKNEDSGNWEVRIDDDFLSEAKDGRYEVWFDDYDGERYWMSGGIFKVAETNASLASSVMVNGRVVGTSVNAEIATVANVSHLVRDVDGVPTETDVFCVNYEARMSIIIPSVGESVKVAFADLSEITGDGDKMVTFELLIDCREKNVSAVSLGMVDGSFVFSEIPITWIGGMPDLTTSKQHLLTFRWFNGTLFASKQGEYL